MNFKIICKHGNNAIHYYIKFNGYFFWLGFISFQHIREIKKEIAKQIFQENQEYDLENFIYALSQFRQLKTAKGIDYTNIVNEIQKTLKGENKHE
ncbi:MAG: hypothetical protein QW648_03640 [Nanoarchaeales archaeon]